MRSMLRLHSLFLLLAPAGDDGGGGGGGGGDGGKGGDPPKPMTEEDVGRIVNAAITSHLKRSLAPAVTEAIGALKIGDLVADAVKKAVPPPADPPTDTGGKGGGGKPDPKIAALEESMKALQAKYEEEKTGREKAEEQRKAEAARNGLRAALSKHVQPEALDDALDLHIARGVLGYDDEGRQTFKVKRAAAAGMPEEDVAMPLDDGVAHWAKSAGAKRYLPPPKGGADTARPGAAPRQIARGSDGTPVYEGEAKTDAERFRRAEERAQALAAKLNQST